MGGTGGYLCHGINYAHEGGGGGMAAAGSGSA